jgi:hypothetical protein
MTASDPSRGERLAVLRTLHDLRRSVAMGRPMTWPAVRRLAMRRGATGQGIARLQSTYRRHQPFRLTNISLT